MADPALGLSASTVAAKPSWTRISIVILKLAVAGGILAWLIVSGQLNLSRLWDVHNRAALGALIGCRLVATTLPAVRWHRMARALRLELSLGRAIHIGLTGNFFGAVAPGMLGQDAARLVYGRTLQLAGGAKLVSTVLADRMVGVFTLAGLGVLLAGWRLADAGTVPITRLAMLGVLAVLMAVLLAAALSRVDLAAARQRIWRPIGELADAMVQYRHHPRTLAFAVALSVAGHMAGFAAFYFAFVSLGAAPTFLPVLALSPVLTLVRGIPTTPMGLGVADWFGEKLYSSIHLSDGAEVVMLTRLVTIGIAAACGVLLLVPVRRRRQG